MVTLIYDYNQGKSNYLTLKFKDVIKFESWYSKLCCFDNDLASIVNKDH